ncbi:MAG TPA: MFS transporter [Solibacterales bacterium]|nr:MFS transporter [Bryobacterales bacterium]
MLSAAIAVSYFDRQTLPVAISAITRDIPISNTQFSQLQAAFLTAYALMYAGGGRLMDAMGTRLGFLSIMAAWSLACAAHGLANSVLGLGICRFLLGAGEGGGFPAATKAVAEWFPARERSTALGMINAGTAVGAVAAPPLIALVIGVLDWRWVFYLSGLLGLFWTLWWFRAYYPPAAHPRLGGEERREIAEVLHRARSAEPAVPWFRLLGYRQVWGLLIGKLLSDAAWYFYLFWLPKYLYDARGFDIKQVGYFAWIPYAASGVGCLVGGSLSSRLLARGHSLNASRKLALGLSAALMPWVFFVSYTPVELAIVLFSLAFFGQQSWSTLMMTLPADMFAPKNVGSVAGLEGFGGAIGGVLFGLAAGYLLDHGLTYKHIFMMVSSLHLLAFGVILLAIPEVRRLDAAAEPALTEAPAR